MRLTSEQNAKLKSAYVPVMDELSAIILDAKNTDKALRKGPLNDFLKGLIKIIGKDSSISLSLDGDQIQVGLVIDQEERGEVVEFLENNGGVEHHSPSLYSRFKIFNSSRWFSKKGVTRWSIQFSVTVPKEPA